MSEISNVKTVNQNYETKKPKLNVAGTIVGGVAGSAIRKLPNKIAGKVLIKQLTQPSLELTKDQIDIVNKAADKVVNEVSGLAKKGVKIHEASGFIADMARVTDGKNAFYFHKMNSFIKNICKQAGYDAEELCGVAEKSVNINKNKLSLATFHELGHAFNFNCSKFWKGMQKMRLPGMVIASLMSAFPLLTKQEVPEEGKELTKGQKIKNGVRKASPFVATLSMLPTVLEEGMASFRGNKWAKEVLDSPLAKKVMKTNAAGFASYTLVAIATGVAGFVGMKIKDHFANKQNAQQNPQNVNAHQA